MSEVPDGHYPDEFGTHYEDTCYTCLLGKEVKGECRCGKCCRLIIEVELQDAEREPRIKEKGSPILGAPDAAGHRELEGYLLNSKDNDYACAFLDQATNLCTIYPTRPLVCRLFDCAGEGREQLIELGMIEKDEEPRKPVQGLLF
jgi:Fe-S-cluster containining protein